jgi:hypothetical protein
MTGELKESPMALYAALHALGQGVRAAREMERAMLQVKQLTVVMPRRAGHGALAERVERQAHQRRLAEQAVREWRAAGSPGVAR